MCEPVSATMAVMSVAGAAAGEANKRKAWAAQENASRKQKIQMVKQANVNDAALRIKDGSNLDATRRELEDQSLAAIKVESSVETAIGESNLEGRSMDRIRRDVENVNLKTQGRIKQNYQRDYTNILAERVSNRDNLIGGIEGKASAPKPSALGGAINIAQAGVSGYAGGMQLQSAVNTAPSDSMFGITGVLQSNRGK